MGIVHRTADRVVCSLSSVSALGAVSGPGSVSGRAELSRAAKKRSGTSGVDAQEQSDGDLPGFEGRLRFRARSGTVFPFRILTQLTGILGISGNLLVNNLVSSATQADGINLHGYVRDARITNSASPCSGRYRVGAAWLLLQLISRAFPENERLCFASAAYIQNSGDDSYALWGVSQPPFRTDSML